MKRLRKDTEILAVEKTKKCSGDGNGFAWWNKLRSFGKSKVTPSSTNTSSRQLKKYPSATEYIAGMPEFGVSSEIQLTAQTAETARLLWNKRLIHPNSPWKLAWDLVVLLAVVYTAIALPFFFAFSVNGSTAGLVVYIIIEFIFSADLLINLRTAFVSSGDVEGFPVGALVTSQRLIMRNYLRSWFFVDFISLIPFEYILPLGEHYARLVGLLKCIRLLRMRRILTLLDKYGSGAVWRILRLVLMFAILTHWVACGWWLIVEGEESVSESWKAENGLTEATATERYLESFFAALLMIGGKTAGPISQNEFVYHSVWVLFGALIHATIFGNITVLLGRLDLDAQRFQRKMEEVNQQIRHLDLPQELRGDIENFYEYLWLRHRAAFDGKEILPELGYALRQKVMLHLHRDLIRSVPLFKNCDPAFVENLVVLLESRIYMAGEVIMHAGNIGCEMFFITSGSVEIFLIDDDGVEKVVNKIDAPGHLGEVALVKTHGRRTASARAVTNCDMYVLWKDAFDELLNRFPDEKIEIDRVATQVLLRLMLL
eukprot:Rmarinus@m.20675